VRARLQLVARDLSVPRVPPQLANHLPISAGARMKAPSIVILSAIVLLFGAGTADGQARPEQKSASTAEATFKSLDRNRDNALSKVEARADNSIAAVFATADINLDGYITKPEYLAYVERSTSRELPSEPPPNR
jgi:hypothetical protein